MRTITDIDDDTVTLSDGSKLVAYHEQDCCESVYADWASGLADVRVSEFDLTQIEIEDVPEAGFRLNKQFIPCYNSQNGYYSDNLSLQYFDADGQKVWERPLDTKDEIE